MLLDKLHSSLSTVSKKYSLTDFNFGGCGYIALFLYENLQKYAIKSDIVVLSCECCYSEIYSRDELEERINNLDSFEDFYPSDYGINISHLVVKAGNRYYDLNGERNFDNLFEEFDLHYIETMTLQPDTLRKMLKIQSMWNRRFDRKNNVFRIKRDLNRVFQNASD